MWRPLVALESPSAEEVTDPFALRLGQVTSTCLLVAYEVGDPASGLLCVAYPEASIGRLLTALKGLR